MTDDRSLERAARSWLEVGPTRAPDGAVETALLRIQTTTQERDLRVPWIPAKATPTRLVALAALVALVLAGLVVIGGGGRSNQVAPTTPTVVPASSGAGQVLYGVGQPLPTLPPGAVDSLTITPNGPDKSQYTTGPAGIAVLPVVNQTANSWTIDVITPGRGLGPCNADKRTNRQPVCDLAPGEAGVLDLRDYSSGMVEVRVYQPPLAASPTIVTVTIPAATP